MGPCRVPADAIGPKCTLMVDANYS
eukprot:COSAG01_NODE_57645_length_311_cov_0.514151_1_plen_24_part_10